LKKRKIEFIATGVKRVHPDENVLELDDGRRIDYDYLVIATGPKLAFDEIEGLGPNGHTQSVCHIDHAMHAQGEWGSLSKDPGPIVVGAVQGASCFGPAYEFAMIMETDLRRRKIRDRVPMTFVTAEPYIGHLGLGGVGDSKGMMESILREKHVKWICNAKVTKVEAGKMFVTEHDEDGKPKKEHELPFKYSMMLPAFKGVDAVFGIDGLTNPRGFILIDQHQRNPKYKNIFAVGVCVAIPPVEADADPDRHAEDRLHDRVDGDRHGAQHCRRARRARAAGAGDVERGVSRRLRRFSGAAFVALPQIPPRNVNWFSQGKWVHLAKIAYEKYFMRKMKQGTTETIYEKIVMDALGIMKLKGNTRYRRGVLNLERKPA
jgi:sulfide:quinone oxidoreductase